MKLAKALIIIENPKETIIITEDGGIASTYHNGEHIILELYRMRVKKKITSISKMWEDLSEGKMSSKDFRRNQKVSKNIIDTGLKWLMVNRRFSRKTVKIKDRKLQKKAINDFLFPPKNN